MAKTIAQLTDATTVNAADELIIQQGGIAKRATGAELAKGLNTINGTVNVKDFGAVGDGATDDRPAIESAAATGRTVVFPLGSYAVASNLTVTAPCKFLAGAKIKPASGVTVTLDNIESDSPDWTEGQGEVRTFTEYSPYDFGYTEAVKDFAFRGSMKKAMSATDAALAPQVTIESTYTGNGAVALDFSGAPGATIPVGLYVQHEQVGNNSANNAFTHSIMAYALNNAAGDNDVIGITGRTIKTDVVGGIGDAGGVWGSAYQLSQQNGGVMAIEGAIYQNVAGSPSGDRLGPKWSCSLHAVSISTGSPATAGLAIDAQADVLAGTFGYWNGIIIDRSIFHGSGIAGSVGINCGSWNASYAPQYGIKFGSAYAHLYSTTNLTLMADNGIYLDTSVSNTAMFHDLGTGALSNFVIRSKNNVGVVQSDLFVCRAADGRVGIGKPDPDTRLHVGGGVARIETTASTDGTVEFAAADTYIYGNTTTNAVTIGTDGINRFFASNNGVAWVGDLTITSATVANTATAGGNALPANPVGFLVVSINGTSRKIPYYAT